MDVLADAVISPCERYRYRLTRKWGEGKCCGFIMLNPSTADATQDDATIRRCMSYARAWDCTELIVVNLFAFRATEPKDMLAAADPVGPDNQNHIEWAARNVDGPLICAWGALGGHLGQDQLTLEWLKAAGATPMALSMTKQGHPGHPLYLKADLRPVKFMEGIE